MIFGIPVVLILAVALMAVGSYVCAYIAEGKYRKDKRERKHREYLEKRGEAALDYAYAAYDHARDPITREAVVRDICGAVKTALDAGDIVLGDQFKSRTKVQEVAEKA